MIDISIARLAVLVPPLLLLEGLFSGSEIALLSADKLTLKRHARGSTPGARGSRLALDLANHPERVLSTTLLITSACVITISALISLYFLERRPGTASGVLAVLVTSPIVVLIGELIPKTVYQRHGTKLAPWVAYPVAWTYWIFFPITRVLSSYTTRLSRLVGPIEELLAGKKRTTREELRALLSWGKRETEIKTSERKMIKRIFDFKESEAKHALIPLVQVAAIELEAGVNEALERFQRHRHSRMPVYSERVDNIIGVLEASDLMSTSDLSQSLRHYITPAHYVAETQSLEDLLLEMRREDEELVVVVDEHGGAVGIITFEDIVEEIVGEISDEHDPELVPYKQLGDRSWLVQARTEISQLNEALKCEIPQGEYETLSGFLLQQFGRIPDVRDELFFNTPAGSYKFTIRKATERHIEAVLVEKLQAPE
jgi:CBS domain containing-hemolysin-like protein